MNSVLFTSERIKEKEEEEDVWEQLEGAVVKRRKLGVEWLQNDPDD